MKKIVIFALISIQTGFIIAQNPYKGQNCIIKSEYVYEPGKVSYQECHASTIAAIKKGLIVAWFGGSAEMHPDVGIWISYFKKGKWSQPFEVVNGVQYKSKRYPCWNPVLFGTDNQILLFYKVGPNPSTWWGELITSNDNGVTWTLPHRLPEDIYGPIKNKPVLLKNGILLCPSSSEHDGWRVHMEMTSDFGINWERTPELNEKDIEVIQPTILKHPSELLQMLCRSTNSKIMTSWSEDNGYSWTELTPTDLPNPNSGIDAVTLKDGRHLLVYNHQPSGRNILNVAISDDGNVWKAVVLLENDANDAEYSYPAVIQTDDELIHITYTWRRKTIKHVILDPSKIESRPIVNGIWPQE